MLRKETENKNIVMPLYKSMFLPYLEWYVQFWFPSSKNDAAELEKVQGKARKMMKLPYEKRKNGLGLLSLKKTQSKGVAILNRNQK